jgi:hypothetical protein
MYGVDGKLMDQGIDAPLPYNDVLMLRVGKKAAGCELDGREWMEFPCIQQNTVSQLWSGGNAMKALMPPAGSQFVVRKVDGEIT